MILKHFSLFELNTYLRRVIALNFEEPLWVRAEVLQAKSSKGHVYLELIQKDEADQQIKAKASAVIWSGTYKKINQQLEGTLSKYLQTGSEVSVLAEITYHEVYGFKLAIQNIDPGYTLGQMEKQKLETIEKLRSEQLLTKNKKIQLPSVLQNIAVISSADAAGFHDFHTQLKNNPYQYNFRIKLYSNAVQGNHVVSDFLRNMVRVEKMSKTHDCVVIIRGGGSKLDLSSFDQYEVCREIGNCNIPVFTGIGHETDQVVADLAAFQDFKTPTAVASFIITQNLHFESSMAEKVERISKKIYDSLALNHSRLETKKFQLNNAYRLFLQDRQNHLDSLRRELRISANQRIAREQFRIETRLKTVQLLNPENMFNRGYSIVSLDGKIPITSIAEVSLKSKISTLLKDGMLLSSVNEIKSAKKK